MLPRFRHIFVPLDFTTKNQAALDIAFEMAEANAARVTLFHVIERIDEAVEDGETDTFYERLRINADAELEHRLQRFIEAGVTAEYKLRLGKRAEEIIRFVTQREIDLVILSSHPIDADQPMKSLATLSYQVSILAPCPVLLVK